MPSDPFAAFPHHPSYGPPSSASPAPSPHPQSMLPPPERPIPRLSSFQQQARRRSSLPDITFPDAEHRRTLPHSHTPPPPPSSVFSYNTLPAIREEQPEPPAIAPLLQQVQNSLRIKE